MWEESGNYHLPQTLSEFPIQALRGHVRTGAGYGWPWPAMAAHGLLAVAHTTVHHRNSKVVIPTFLVTTPLLYKTQKW